MKKQPWYTDGLYFKCKLCGNCCSGVPGHVWITDEEIESIAVHLEIEETDFRKRYIINVDGKGSRLVERQNNDCVFFNSNHGCVIYDHRPHQCKTWPFWKGIVETHKTWTDSAITCPGIGQGNRFSAEDIAVLLK